MVEGSFDSYDQISTSEQRPAHQTDIMIKTKKEGIFTPFSPSSSDLLDQSCQTDQGLHFSYILAFLKALEDRITNVNTDMRSMGTHVENMADEFLKKSKDKLKELQAILSRIRSL